MSRVTLTIKNKKRKVTINNITYDLWLEHQLAKVRSIKSLESAMNQGSKGSEIQSKYSRIRQTIKLAPCVSKFLDVEVNELEANLLLACPYHRQV